MRMKEWKHEQNVEITEVEATKTAQENQKWFHKEGDKWAEF